jgi:hypothetical protein
MTENISFTRISDLPDMANGPPMMGGGGGGGGMGAGAPPYMQQMNVHPNPYGIENKHMGGGMSPPNQTGMIPSSVEIAATSAVPQYTQQQIQELQNMVQTPLPSRDIPTNVDGHAMDDQIRVNYIPPVKKHEDYVGDYLRTTDQKNQELERQTREALRSDAFVDAYQPAIIVAILFFIFHIPLVNTLLFKRFAFLSIYSSDGNFNFGGLVFKSLVFGAIFAAVTNGMDWMAGW